MAEEKFVSLDNLADGAARELFDNELQRVLANIVDPNTEVDIVREVTLHVKIKIDDSRQVGAVSVQAKSKLAPFRAAGTVFYIGRVRGELVAVESNPAQMTFDDLNSKNSNIVSIEGGKQ